MSRIATLTLAFAASGLLACADDAATPMGSGSAPGASDQARVPDRPDLPSFCKRPGDTDPVRELFCGEQAPKIASLHDLQAALGLVFDPSKLGPVDQDPMLTLYENYEQPALVVLNTTTALSSRLVSTINPRAISLGVDTTLAFNRGEQQLELIARESYDRTLNLYLVRFQQACNTQPGGCTPGDLYTPRLESDWTTVTIEDDEDLKNTAADCRQCHQRQSERPILLMRELDGPWTHFFMPDQDPPLRGPEDSGVDIVRAYHKAKGDEPYGNVPWAAMRATVGFTLQSLVDRPQPLVFDGDQVQNERWPWTMENGFAKTPVTSAMWYAQYEAFKRGDHLAMPHYEPFPSDPGKLAALTEIYQSYRAGEIDADSLPDLSDIYPDDPQQRAEIGLQTEPGAGPAQTLVQACGSCHNDVLDQSISRAKFNVDLARLDRAELERAIERIALPLDDPRHMPPRAFRQLDPGAIVPLIRYLSEDARSAEDLALLQHAAETGMAVMVTGLEGSVGSSF